MPNSGVPVNLDRQGRLEHIKYHEALELEAQVVQVAINEANAAAQFATEQGDRAKEYSDNIETVMKDGPVQTVNGQTGNITGIATQQQIESVTTQLANSAFITKISSGSVRYGLIEHPPEFPKVLSFQLFREKYGRIIHNYSFDKLVSSNNVYLSREGSDVNDGLTKETPVKGIDRALEIAESISGTVNIRFLSKFIPSQARAGVATIGLTKNINWISELEGGSYIISGYDPFTFAWTADGNAFKTTRSAVSFVVDYNLPDFFGEPSEYEKMASLAECNSKRGSWYTDGTSIWVNPIDGKIPSDNIAFILPLSYQFKFEVGDYTLLIDNIGFWNHQSTANTFHALSINGTQGGRVFVRKGSYRYARNNGLNHTNVGEMYNFESIARDNGYDGLNYHGSGDEFAFEYYCESFDNGDIIKGTGNATTAHDGIAIMRVGTVGRDCWGPTLADVNGCKSLNYDVKMADSLLNNLNSRTSASLYFDDSLAVAPGKAWLINCSGGGKNTYSISSDGLAEIEIRERFSGDNIHENAMATLKYAE